MPFPHVCTVALYHLFSVQFGFLESNNLVFFLIRRLFYIQDVQSLMCLYVCGSVENYTASINCSKYCIFLWNFVVGTQQRHCKETGTFWKPYPLLQDERCIVSLNM